MIKIAGKGDFKKTRDFIDRARNKELYSSLDRYGRLGVDTLSRMTPTESGLTAASWHYRIVRTHRHVGIEWFNTNEVRGTPVAVLIQYGHATGTGGYVPGRDFINPAMRPIFDQIADDIWKKVMA